MSPEVFWISKAAAEPADRLRRRAELVRSLALPALAGAGYAAILGIAALMECDPLILIVDSADVASECVVAGLVSNLGILLWTAAAAVCLFAVLSAAIDERRHAQLIAAGGLLTAALAVDDLFRIHDSVLPQSLCYALYAASACLILLWYRREILQLDFAWFFLAGAYLALSILTDLAQNHLPFEYAVVQIFEEGFKFVGIATWCTFWISSVLKSRHRPARRFVRMHVSSG